MTDTITCGNLGGEPCPLQIGHSCGLPGHYTRHDKRCTLSAILDRIILFADRVRQVRGESDAVTGLREQVAMLRELAEAVKVVLCCVNDPAAQAQVGDAIKWCQSALAATEPDAPPQRPAVVERILAELTRAEGGMGCLLVEKRAYEHARQLIEVAFPGTAAPPTRPQAAQNAIDAIQGLIDQLPDPKSPQGQGRVKGWVEARNIIATAFPVGTEQKDENA